MLQNLMDKITGRKRAVDVYMPPEPVVVYVQPEPDEDRCEYCGGVTDSDTHGNCIACGSPRNKRQREQDRRNKFLQDNFGYYAREEHAINWDIACST